MKPAALFLAAASGVRVHVLNGSPANRLRSVE